MKIIRYPLAVLALASFTAAFARGADTGSAGRHAGHPAASQATACQMARCAMGAEKKASEAPATGPWYLPTWEEGAVTNGTRACDEARSHVDPAQLGRRSAAGTTPSSGYLPDWEEAVGTATEVMACCKTPCPMDQAKPASVKAPVDSWYLPS